MKLSYKIITHSDYTVEDKKGFSVFVTIPGLKQPKVIQQDHGNGRFKPFYDKAIAVTEADKFIKNYNQPIPDKIKKPEQMELF